MPRVGCTIAIDQHPSPSQQHPSSTTILPTKSWALLERVRTITMAQEHAGSSGWGVAQRICCRERLQVFLIPELVHGTHGGGQNIPATGQGWIWKLSITFLPMVTRPHHRMQESRSMIPRLGQPSPGFGRVPLCRKEGLLGYIIDHHASLTCSFGLMIGDDCGSVIDIVREQRP